MLSFRKSFFNIYHMKRIDRYGEHLLEKEFNSIVASVMLIAESQTGPNTFEWDLTEPKKTFNIKDKEEFSAGDTVEFDIEQKKLKDYLGFIKSKAKSIGLDLIPTERMKELLRKLVEMAPSREEAMSKVKQYFDRLASELKSLPYELKKSILKKFVYVFMAFMPLVGLIPDDATASKDNTVLKEIRTEVESGEGKAAKERQVDESSFEIAQEFVSLEEGGYTDFRKDKGNWTSNQIGGGCLIGTNHGIAAPTLINADILPSGKEGRLFKMCYGTDANYSKLCGGKELTFAEQWERDTKNIKSIKDLEIKWKRIMQSLSYETALDIFQSQYWDAQNLGLIKNQSIANILYDGCVNQGAGAMAGVLKGAADKLGIDLKGNAFSEENISKINKADQKKLFVQIKQMRKEIYMSSDRFDDFGEGWLDRLAKIEFGSNQKNEVA